VNERFIFAHEIRWENFAAVKAIKVLWWMNKYFNIVISVVSLKGFKMVEVYVSEKSSKI
jgi:hypothetical protein